MVTALASQPLSFERRIHPVAGDRHHHWTVAFARGAVIDCASEAEARRMAEAHLERARQHQLDDTVVSAIWVAPQSTGNPAA